MSVSIKQPIYIGAACLSLSACVEYPFVDCGMLGEQLEEVFEAGSTSKDVWIQLLATLANNEFNAPMVEEFLGDWKPGDNTVILSTECYGTEARAVTIHARFLTPRLGEGSISASIRKGPLQAYSFYLSKDIIAE